MERCKREEEAAKLQYYGDSKGLKLLLKKASWIPWSLEGCRYSCPRHRKYMMECYEKHLKSNAFKHIRNLL